MWPDAIGTIPRPLPAVVLLYLRALPSTRSHPRTAVRSFIRFEGWADAAGYRRGRSSTPFRGLTTVPPSVTSHKGKEAPRSGFLTRWPRGVGLVPMQLIVPIAMSHRQPRSCSAVHGRRRADLSGAGLNVDGASGDVECLSAWVGVPAVRAIGAKRWMPALAHRAPFSNSPLCRSIAGSLIRTIREVNELANPVFPPEAPGALCWMARIHLARSLR